AGVVPPVADFTANPTTILVGENVDFTDLSLNNPDTWSWDFGDGQNSTIQNPSHTYTSTGPFTVSLTVSNSAGADIETKVNYILVEALPTNPPVADFTAEPTDAFVGDQVQFTDLSSNSPTSWLWDFGDGNGSTLQNPVHSYSAASTYTVSLTATNAHGDDEITKTGFITVNEPPAASYCTPSINNSNDWIVSVSVNGVPNYSGQNDNGFTLFTSPVFDLDAGATYPITLDPYNDRNRNFWRIWVDVSGNSDFIEAGETLFAANNKKGTVTGSITIPANAVASTRLRIAMKTGSSPAPCDNFNGEMEDYLVNINHSNEKSIIFGNLVDIVPEPEELSLDIYPNPFNNEIHISIKGSEQFDKVILHLFDVSGRSIFNKEYDYQPEIIIRDLHLNPGSYFIRIQLDEYVETEHLIKTK
ncbi:MAG: PKD domain-containing protein, partial [Draconibacterium sp.]|nr:PKD domain-containing protein [Draconibacterium sp.]